MPPAFSIPLDHPRQAGELTKEQEAKLLKIDFVFDAKQAQIVRDEYLAGRLSQLHAAAAAREKLLSGQLARAWEAADAARAREAKLAPAPQRGRLCVCARGAEVWGGLRCCTDVGNRCSAPVCCPQAAWRKSGGRVSGEH